MLISQTACIKMAMPRPGGKALKIAERVVPHLKAKSQKECPKRRRVPNDEVEMTMVEINEQPLRGLR